MASLCDLSDNETDDASCNDEKNEAMENVLASFREKWQNELKGAESNKLENKECKGNNNFNADEDEDFECIAKRWFLNGAELEKSGDFYAAIQCYKRAVQLVPDIEFKINQKIIPSNSDLDIEEEFEDFHLNNCNSEDLDEESIKNDLLSHIQRKMAKSQSFCFSQCDLKITHISKLPMEIFLYILKWVVSADLDLRSLEMCSLVCRGFYLSARDNEIWRLACLKVWGGNCGYLNSAYPTWREMYIQRPRLHFNGCYISKTTYIRHGENSFQDQFYRPWHLVAYYRYLRFFPEGLVFMLTTPDEPQHCVSLLKTRTPKTTTLLRGHYRLKDDRVLLVLQDVTRQTNAAKKSAKKINKYVDNLMDQSYHLEFQILNQNKRKHIQLHWVHYSIIIKPQNGNETECAFDVSSNRYPPLWFSRVKSYMKEAQLPLQ